MPSAREINRRIKSVTNTQQITKAMKMVSSVRLRRAQERAMATAPFTDKIEGMLHRLAAAASSEVSPLFEQREVRRTCYIIVGADKGLEYQQSHGRRSHGKRKVRHMLSGDGPQTA